MNAFAKIRLALCLAAALAPALRLAANIDNVRFSNISVYNGLPHNGIYDVLHDCRGFIWIATREGLCRYDGYNMRTYYHDPTDPFSIPQNTIRSIFEDSRNRLWIGTEGGSVLYDRGMDRFIRLSSSEGESSYFAYSFLESSDGRIYMSTSLGLLVFDEEQGMFRPLYGIGERSPLPTPILDMAEGGDGMLWLATNRGLIVFDPSQPGKAESFSHPGFDPSAPRPVLTVENDSRSRMWFGGWGGVWVYDPSDESLRGITPANGLKAGIVRAIEFDSEGNVWIGGERGIDIVSPQGSMRHISQGLSDVTGISDKAIYVIHRDRNGNMWAGTYFGGLNVMFANTTVFTNYPYGFSNKHLSGKAVRQIIENDDHSLWIATEDGGLNYFDRRTREFLHYTGPQDRIALSYYNVHSLLKDRGGDLWIGTFTGGLNKYDPRTEQTTRPRLIKGGAELESAMIFSLLEDGDGNVWIGTSSGLFVQRSASQAIEHVDRPELANTFVYSMAFDSRGFLWIGTRRSGLWCYDIEQEKVSRIARNGEEQSFITSIMVDSKDNIWAGTNSGGVVCFDRGLDKPLSYTVKDGLPSNAVMGIVSDNSGQVWISTDNGLCRFSEDPSKVRIYTTADGLPINLFNFASAFRASDGELFFGSVNGMISFYPDRIDTSRPPLKVEFTDFRIQGRPVSASEKGSRLEKDITETASVTLSSAEASSFSFGYTALNFSHTSNIRYAIRMEGANPSWQEVGNQHQVLFSNLRHGRYTLSVKASYDGIDWDETGTRSLIIHIRPPFHLSVWAMLIYCTVLTAAAFGIYYFVRGRIRMRRRIAAEQSAKLQAEELNRQKMIFFGNISHDLKTPLTLILGPLQKTVADKKTERETRGTLSVVLQNAQRMKNLLEELILMSKIEMGHMKVTVQQGDVLEFIDRMCDIFRVFAGDNGINFFVNIENHDSLRVWFSPTNVERIVYNLLSNAFKFTPYGGIIRIKAWLSEGPGGGTMLNIHVKDTGSGIAPEVQEKIFENYYTSASYGKHKGAGIGLALTRSLVKLHRGEISVESAPEEGALFRVTLDVGRDAYTPGQISEVPVETGAKASAEYINESNSYLQQARIEIQSRAPKRFQILIVEDNRELNEFVTNIFSKDFDILNAYDGTEGYEMAVRTMPDIIISDIMMPGIDGLEMTRKLKSELLTSHIPVALLTARSEEREKIEGFEYGADAYIEKPFNPQRLELQIKNLLNTRYSNIERFKHDTKFDTKKLTRNPRDEKFLNSMVEVIMKNLDNDQLAVKDITDALGISRSLLHIKLKNLADLSVTEFIRNIRMKEAREKLMQGMNVSEASFAVGISDPNYFTKCFKKQFGQTPSDYIRNLKND